jgi:Glycosyl transferases group 1
MRFLIVPDQPNPYDQRMTRGLASGLVEIGHQAHAFVVPPPDVELVAACKVLGTDVVVQVNRVRPVDPPLPPDVRHISWYQDVFTDTRGGMKGRIRESDLVYALGDPEVLGLRVGLPCFLGSLFTGVDEATLRFAPRTNARMVDFSLCGYIPAPFGGRPSLKRDLLWYVESCLARILPIGRLGIFRPALLAHVPYAQLISLRDTVETLYSPLRGDLDIHYLASAMLGITGWASDVARPPVRGAKRKRRLPHLGLVLRPYGPEFGPRRVGLARSLQFMVLAATGALERRQAELDRVVRYLSREYPRLLDRVALIRAVLNVSNSLELYGPGWDIHKEFAAYHHGILDDLDALLAVYRRTRVNLGNNTHGLGLHSRNLECMAVGGFLFTHASRNDGKPGGLHTSFEPGVHYGMFTPENLEEEARRWLRDQKRRTAAARRATRVIRDRHMWRHRAQQLVDDLSK